MSFILKKCSQMMSIVSWTTVIFSAIFVFSFVFPEQANTGRLFCPPVLSVGRVSCCFVLNMHPLCFNKQFVVWWPQELVIFVHLSVQNYTGLQWPCSQVVGKNFEQHLLRGRNQLWGQLPNYIWQISLKSWKNTLECLTTIFHTN